MIRSPGERVQSREQKAISSAQLWIIAPVLDRCFSSPFTVRVSSSACGSMISSAVTIHGPIGAAPSAHFPSSQSKKPTQAFSVSRSKPSASFRSEMSLPTV